MKDIKNYKHIKNESEMGSKVERNTLSTIDFESAKADMGYKYEKGSDRRRYANKGGMVITKDSVYEYDMDCLMKKRQCY